MREAIAEYGARTDKLSERERLRMLAILERVKRMKPTRTQAQNDAEIAAVRSARRSGGRRHRVE